MTSTRRTDELPEAIAAPVFEVLERARAAAAITGVELAAWVAAESGQRAVRTGYKAARRVASAGQYAAHAVRLAAAGDQPWTAALTSARTAAAISSWDWDERMYAALELRRTFKDLPDEQRNQARDAQVVAAWLTHASGPGLPAVTGRLCAHVLEHEATSGRLGDAWYCVHGLRLLAELAAAAGGGHRPEALREAVRRVHAVSGAPKTAIAAAAGITRPTLDAWLAAEVSEGTATISEPTQGEHR